MVVDGPGDGTTAPACCPRSVVAAPRRGWWRASGELVFVAAPARVLAAGPPAARSEGMCSKHVLSLVFRSEAEFDSQRVVSVY